MSESTSQKEPSGEAAKAQALGVGPQREVNNDYCREIETYLCRKNDGHLIRVVGPSFELVSGWAVRGVPLKIAFRGIDRYFERYYRKGPRRRPVRIDFCDADVLDAFDEWRRAVGLVSDEGRSAKALAERGSRGRSLPEHLERALLWLTQARASGGLGPAADETIDRVARELDAARATARGVRGAARQKLLGRLAELDAELLNVARASLDEPTRASFLREAGEELASFRATMTPESFARAREAAVDRLTRERYGLPAITFT